MIRDKEVELASSYVLIFENSKNPYELRKRTILRFVKENVNSYVDIDSADKVKALAEEIIATGIKTADAYHVACAILSESDCFLTTDDRLLNYTTDKVRIEDPTQFIREWEVLKNEDDK